MTVNLVADVFCGCGTTAVETGLFGYTIGRPSLGEDGRYQIDRRRQSGERSVAEDEIDLDSGFLIAPPALPAKPILPDDSAADGETDEDSSAHEDDEYDSAVDVAGHDSTPLGEQSDREIAVSFTADASKLYAAWYALANLADVAWGGYGQRQRDRRERLRQSQAREWRLGAALGTRADRGGRHVKRFTAERPLPRIPGR